MPAVLLVRVSGLEFCCLAFLWSASQRDRVSGRRCAADCPSTRCPLCCLCGCRDWSFVVWHFSGAHPSGIGSQDAAARLIVLRRDARCAACAGVGIGVLLFGISLERTPAGSGLRTPLRG